MKYQRPPRPRLWRMAGLGLVVSSLALLVAPLHGAADTQPFYVLHGQPQNLGMLMSLTADSGVIESATDQNAKSLLGVVAPNQSSFDLQSGQITVETGGAATALVNTLGGDIRVGDRITTSPVQGIGTKANSNAWIVGIAQASLDAKTAGAVKSSVVDSKGHQHTVYVASIPLVVKVTYYTTATGSGTVDQNSVVPSSIQRIADSLAGKHVSTRALLLTFILFLTGVIAAAMVVKSAVQGSLLAIARQPLAKSVILREEWRSFGLATGILATALIASLLILRFL